VQWNIPCDPVGAPATVFGIPRNDGEGLLCYFIRAFNLANSGSGTFYGSFVGPLTGNVTGNVTGNLTGNVTGNVTGNISGNAGTATTLQTARTIAISGDITGTATSFNGSSNISIASAISSGSIVNDDINASAGILDTKLATISTSGKVANSATTATNANTANTIVARDASGNFSVGAITGSLLGNATSATNIAGGLLNSIPYQTAANTTGLLPAGTNGQVLGILSGVLQWVSAPAAVTASALAGGSAGQVPWQTGSNATGFTAAGTTGQVLTSNGTSAPTWSLVSPTSLSAGAPTWDTSGNVSTGSRLFIGRQDSGSEGGEIALARASDNTAGWFVDAHGTGNTPSLRVGDTVDVRLAINNGNVGIGTSSPKSQAHVSGAGQLTAAISDSGTQGGMLRVSDPSFSAGAGGAILFSNGQGDAANSVGFAAIKGLLNNGSSNTTGDLAISTRNSATDTALTERIRIATSGNVGIGTSSPSAKLQVDVGATPSTEGVIINSPASSNITIRPNSSSGANNGIVQSGDTAIIYTGGAINTGALSIAPWATSASGLRIDSAGNVGIGTSSPFVKLSVAGNEATNGVMANVYNFNTSAGSTSSFSASNGVGVNVQLQTFNNYALVNCTTNHNLELRTNNQPRLVITNTGGTDTQGNPITNCPTTAKAWGYVAGGTAGFTALSWSYGVTSVTRTGLGAYTIAITDPSFTIISKGIFVSPAYNSSVNSAGIRIVSAGIATFSIQCYNGTTSADMAFMFMMFSN
jgi:hypothetical protein